MDEATLIAAFGLLDDFLTAGNSAPVWLVVGGGSASWSNGSAPAKPGTWT